MAIKVQLVVRPNEKDEKIFSLIPGSQTLGKGKDNDIVIEDDSVSDYHFKIEEKESHFFIADLGSKQGTYLNGQKISKDLLKNGDIIQAGSIKMLFRKKEQARHLAVTPEKRICPGCGVEVLQPVAFCPRCGMRIASAAVIPSQTFISPVESKGAGILPLLAFICGIFGPLLLGIGWILAIVLGFFSLSIIRHSGGDQADRRKAVWGINLGFIWIIVMGLAIFSFSFRSLVARRIAVNEDSAMASLKNIALTQRFVKSGFLFDRDGDKESEYAHFPDLERVNFAYLDPDLLTGTKIGYRFNMLEASEDRFLCSAVPLRYGWSGRRTFSIDETGVLRGEDVKGEDVSQTRMHLPAISQGKSVFEDYYNEMANDLLEMAKKEAGKKNFEKSEIILDEIRKNYPTSLACQSLDSLQEALDPFLIEQRGKESYNWAQEALKEGNQQQALSILKEITERYSTFSLVGQIEEEILKLEGSIEQDYEEKARKLFAETQDIQLKGEYEEALKKYASLQKELGTTSYFKKVEPLVNNLRKEIEEKISESYLHEILGLSVEEDYEKIFRLISLLKTTYPKSRIVMENYSLLEDLENQSISQKYKARALAAIEKGYYQSALAILEKAVYKNPDLKKPLKSLMEDCYLKTADTSYAKGNFRQAADAYENYLEMEPDKNMMEKSKFMDAYWQLAKLDYASGNPEAAERSLLKTENFFAKDGEFLYLLACTFLKQKKYEKSLKYFSKCLKLDKEKSECYQKRALSYIGVALEKEYELEYLLQGEERGRLISDILGIIGELETEKLRLNAILQKRDSYEAKIEKINLLSEFQKQSLEYEKEVKENIGKKRETLSCLKKIRKALEKGVKDLNRINQAEGMNIDLTQTKRLSERKLSLIREGQYNMGYSLNEEIRIIERGLRYLKRSLNAFHEGSRGISILDSSALVHMLNPITHGLKRTVEGERKIEEAREIKITGLEIRKQFPLKAIIETDKEKYRAGEPLIIEFILVNMTPGTVMVDISQQSAWADFLRIENEHGERVILSRDSSSENPASGTINLKPLERYCHQANVGIWIKEGRFRLIWTYKNMDSGKGGWAGEAISEVIMVKVKPALKGEEEKEEEKDE